MYFAIKDSAIIKIKETNGDLTNVFETSNEVKIVKTKVNGETKVYILLFAEVTDAKSLIMAHGGRYLEDRLIITDDVDDREYSLEGTFYTKNYKNKEEVAVVTAKRCKFVEFPLIDELIKISCGEVTQFVSCLEVIKDDDGIYLDFSR